MFNEAAKVINRVKYQPGIENYNAARRISWRLGAMRVQAKFMNVAGVGALFYQGTVMCAGGG